MTLESSPRAVGTSPDAPHDLSRLHPSIALAPFVEALVVGRRVAVLGDVSLGLAEALLARGARLVHAYDPDAARVAEVLARRAPSFGSPAAGRPAARGVVHAVLSDDLGVRDGAFDAVLVPDLTLFEGRPEAIRRARRLVAPSGAVIVAAPNPDAKGRLIAAPGAGAPGVSYYELYDLLSLQFSFVRMVGQAPFVGYAIVDFAPDREPDVTFDASLMTGTEEPESFVAIAGDRPVALDPYVVVEVPSSAVLGRPAASVASEAREERVAPQDHVQLAEAQARIVLMAAEMDDLRSQKVALVQQLEAAHAAVSAAEARAREAAEEVGEREREAERKAELQAERWRDLEARAGDEHVRAERLTHKVRDLEEELVRQRDRAQKLTKQLDDEKRVRQKAEIELGMARGLARPELDETTVARIEELSEALRSSRSHADSLASELLAKSKETAELRREHDSATMKVAELLREREAATTQVAELGRAREGAEAKVAGLERAREGAEAKVAELGRALAAAQAKIEDIEESAQTIRRPMREAVPIGDEVESGMIVRLTKLEAIANAEHQAVEELKRAVELAERQRDAALERATKLAAALEEERNERKDLVMSKAALEAEMLGVKRRTEQALADREAEVTPEVENLEAALRARGQRIAVLERDLRESERIGRELVAEVEALRAARAGGSGGDEGGGAVTRGGGEGASAPASGASAAPAPVITAPVVVAPAVTAASLFAAVNADAFQHRIDALAADAAQKQAELLASSWKIQALERELSKVRAASADPSVAQRELSSALVRAQAEIAELRRQVSVGGRDTSGVPRAVVEDAVLLHQQMAR